MSKDKDSNNSNNNTEQPKKSNAYSSAEVESRLYQQWLDRKYFHGDEHHVRQVEKGGVQIRYRGEVLDSVRLEVRPPNDQGNVGHFTVERTRVGVGAVLVEIFAVQIVISHR